MTRKFYFRADTFYMNFLIHNLIDSEARNPTKVFNDFKLMTAEAFDFN